MTFIFSIYLTIIFLVISLTTQEAKAAESNVLNVFPLPQRVSNGTLKAPIGCADNAMMMNFSAHANPFAKNYALKSFNRFKEQFLNLHPCSSSPSKKGSLVVTIDSIDDMDEKGLGFGVNESYSLSATSSNNHIVSVHISSATIFGINHAFSTLAQLVSFDFETSSSYFLNDLPLTIQNDQPRFYYRGLLLDTARHFFPVKDIKRTIDGLALSKFNVLHWHISDAQSFPLELESFPELAEKGAWSSQERYSEAEVLEIIQYAFDRSVSIVPEFDQPAHSASVCKSHPEVCPTPLCSTDFTPLIENSFPLDFTKNATYSLVVNLLAKYAEIFNTSKNFLQLGADEVLWFCTEKREYILQWLKAHGMSSMDQGYFYYIQRVARELHSKIQSQKKKKKSNKMKKKNEKKDGFLSSLLSKKKREQQQEQDEEEHHRFIYWNDVYTKFGKRLPVGSVIQVWKSANTSSLVNSILNDNFSAIYSPDSRLYLDQPWKTAKTLYEGSYPCHGVASSFCDSSPSSSRVQVLGSEVCLWSEFVDASSLDMKIWPRATAAIEALWRFDGAFLKYEDNNVQARLEKFRCLLNSQGIGAEQVRNKFTGLGPIWPSSCLS